MLQRFDAYLNGVSFSQLDPAIILRDIAELPPKEDVQQAPRGMRPGTRITSRVRRSLSVQITFNVREYGIAARSRVLDKIASWAGNGGWLTINSRPGQRLYVTPDTPPSMGSSLKWTADMEMTLTAYECPYWEQQWPTVATITAYGKITPLGSYPKAYVECDVTNAGTDTLTTVTITCANTSITLEGLTVPVGEHVVISYTEKGLQQITAAGTSALPNRTAESSDDLIAAARTANLITVLADQDVSATFKVRGRYW